MRLDNYVFCGVVMWDLTSFCFFRNTVQTQALTYTRIHSPLWTHACIPYPYEHLRKTELADRVLRLMKSPRSPRYRQEHRLPLKEYSTFMRHTNVKPEVWTLVGWGYNHPPNHPTSGWFSRFDIFWIICGWNIIYLIFICIFHISIADIATEIL
jgi:hypothetical protein